MTLIQSVKSHQPQHAPRRSAGLPIHVLIVGDRPAVRRRLRRLIDEQPDLVTIGEATSVVTASRQLVRWAEVAVVDDHLDGLWLTRQLRRRSHRTKVLIYTARADDVLALAAVIAGVDALVSERSLEWELCVAIRSLARNRPYLPEVPAAVAGAQRALLEPRDQAIFDLVMDGLPALGVTRRLGVASAELEARRDCMLRTIAPGVVHQLAGTQSR